MNKYIKQNQSRDNLNKKQKTFFQNQLTDNKDYLLDLTENLFVPFHNRTDEDYLAFKKGKGKELEEKLRAPHSSAALCVNFFKYWKEKDPIGFYKILWETIRSKKLGQNENLSQVEYEFEAEHLFGNNETRQTGRPGYIDLEVRTKDGMELIHIESKFTEDFPMVTRYLEANLTNGKIHNREAYRNLFETYFECEPDELMNGSELSKCYQLAQRLLFVVENANDHYASYPEAHVLFLHYDYDGFDKDLLDFPSAIKKPYKDQFKILSYQSLFEALQNSFLNVERHKGWFEYMRRRYFSLK
jgi:thiol-disulfide isomerase/thioredoxin